MFLGRSFYKKLSLTVTGVVAADLTLLFFGLCVYNFSKKHLNIPRTDPGLKKEFSDPSLASRSASLLPLRPLCAGTQISVTVF